MANSSKTKDAATPSKQGRKTSANYNHGQASPKGGPDPTQGVRRDLLSLIHLFLKARLEWDQLVLNHSFALILKSLDTLADIRSAPFPPSSPQSASLPSPTHFFFRLDALILLLNNIPFLLFLPPASSTVQNACFLQKCPEDEVVLEDGYA